LGSEEAIMLRKDIYEGELIPRGYGMAYLSYSKFIVICYPIPLNWVVAGWRLLYRKLQHAPLEKKVIDLVMAEKKKAYQSGYDIGYKHGKEVMLNELKIEYEHIRKEMQL
jgi:hypothetical protein